MAEKEDEEPLDDGEIERFMELFRKYRNLGKLPLTERREFQNLARRFNEQTKHTR